MKTKRSSLSSQILILMMAAVVLILMVQAAQAQVSGMPALAQANANQGNYQNQAPTQNNAQVLSIGMPQKSLARRLLDDTSLTYYQQFLGPTASGPSGQTYNVFQEATDSPGSGQAPYQSFHGVNLRHQINTDWAMGATLSAVNGYTKNVNTVDRNGLPVTNNNQTQFFNARAYVALPALKTSYATLFTTTSIEAPTSSISKENEMRYGWVLQNSLAFNVPSYKWSAGMMSQVYRMYYKNNVQAPTCAGCTPTALQTLIVSGGPYVNYRFNDKWLLANLVTFDWDQRGLQTGTRDFNNNLSDRARTTLSYFPQNIKYLQSVGIFSQALLKFRPQTTAFGADFSIRF